MTLNIIVLDDRYHIINIHIYIHIHVATIFYIHITYISIYISCKLLLVIAVNVTSFHGLFGEKLFLFLLLVTIVFSFDSAIPHPLDFP